MIRHIKVPAVVGQALVEPVGKSFALQEAGRLFVVIAAAESVQ